MFGEPIRLAQFTNGFSLGGGEVQFVELLRKLPDSYAVSVAALEAKGPLLDGVLEMGHSPEVFELRGSAIGPNTLVQVKRFAHWLRDNRIQLVHTHDLLYSNEIDVILQSFYTSVRVFSQTTLHSSKQVPYPRR